MDILKLIEQAEKNNSNEKLRRDVVKDIFGFGRKALLAALPFALGAMPERVNAQTTGNAEADALNLLLAIEYLQYEFYNYALTNTTTLIPASVRPAIVTIRDQQKSHIDFLISSITALGGTPRTALTYSNFEYRIIATRNATTNAPLTYNFGANTVMTDYKVFIRVATIIEDFSSRAYKGQLQALRNKKDLLAAIVQFHSLESRHSAAIRQLVVDAAITNPANLQFLRPWVGYRRTATGFVEPATTNDSGVTGLNMFYDRDNAILANAENKTLQAGMQITGINGLAEITLPYAAESFDEFVLAPYAKTLFNSFIPLPANMLT